MLAEWLPLAVSPRFDGKDDWWAASIDGQPLIERGHELRFEAADLAMKAAEETAVARCRAVVEGYGGAR